MRYISEAILSGLILTASAPCVSGQGFLTPEKGAGVVGVNVGTVKAHGHFLDDGSRLPGFGTRANNVTFSVDYGVTDRLGVTLVAPYIRSKYTGVEEPLNLPYNLLDDGAYHGTLQDLGFEARYNAFGRPFFVTPFAGFSMPSHAYKTIGEAAVGPNLKQFTMGVYAGRLLSPVLSQAFVQGSYSYTVAEKLLGLSLNRSNTDFAVGYFVTPSLSASFLWRGQWMHGGIGFAELYDPGTSAEVFLQSDRLTRQDFNHLGFSTAYSLTSSVSVNFSYLKFVAGHNSHYGHGFSGGIGWSFATRKEPSFFED